MEAFWAKRRIPSLSDLHLQQNWTKANCTRQSGLQTETPWPIPLSRTGPGSGGSLLTSLQSQTVQTTSLQQESWRSVHQNKTQKGFLQSCSQNIESQIIYQHTWTIKLIPISAVLFYCRIIIIYTMCRSKHIWITLKVLKVSKNNFSFLLFFCACVPSKF